MSLKPDAGCSGNRRKSLSDLEVPCVLEITPFSVMSTRRKILTLYVVLLHGLLFIVLWKCDFLGKVLERMSVRKAEPEVSECYRTTLAFQLRQDGCTPAGSVLFFGDSLIQGLCVSAVAERGVNFGIGKDTTAGLLRRIVLYRSMSEARAIVLAVGTNDIPTRMDSEILKDYGEILARLPKGTRKIVCAVFPADESAEKKRNNARISGLNDKLRSLCGTMVRCRFLNSSQDLMDTRGNLKGVYHEGDGLHLNASGYGVWIRDLKIALGTH